MPNYFQDNEDLRYYFERAIDWKALARLSRGPQQLSVAQLRALLERVGRFAAEEVAPEAATIDREALRLEGGEVASPACLERIHAGLSALELHSISLPAELGGKNAPALLHFLQAELLSRADPAVMAHHCLHASGAMAALSLSLREGSTTLDKPSGRVLETRFRELIDASLHGRAWASVDFTVADIDEDPAAITTWAERGEGGSWRVFGARASIPSGHGRWHFVLARTELGDELSETPTGLSLFLVDSLEDSAKGPQRRVVVRSLDEVTGHRGVARCGLDFEGAPAQLIGQPGQGALLGEGLVTHNRIASAFQSLGLAESAYRLARRHAANHRAMGRNLDRLELVAEHLDEMEADIASIRALAMSAALHEEMADKLSLIGACTEGGGDEESRRRELELEEHLANARRLAPLLRFYAAHKAVDIARRALDIHGSEGTLADSPAERLLRDALLMLNSAGTTQRDAVQVARETLLRTLRAPQDFVRSLAHARWRQVSGRDANEKRVARLQYLTLNAQQTLLMRTAGDKVKGLKDKPVAEWPERFGKSWDSKRDFAYAMVHAEHLAHLLVDLAVAELLLEQAHRDEERVPALTRHLERAEPRARYLYERMQGSGRRILSALGDEGSGSSAPPPS